MNGIFIIFGILSIYIFAALIMDRISGSVPPPYPWWTKKHQRVANLQTVAVYLSVLIFALLFFVKPINRYLWLLGTIGFFYAGISALFRQVSADSFGRVRGARKPAIGIGAVLVGIFWLGLALFITFIVLFNPDWWSIPFERPLPTTNFQNIISHYLL